MSMATKKSSMCFLLLLFLFCYVMLKKYHSKAFKQGPKTTSVHKASLFAWPEKEGVFAWLHTAQKSNQAFTKAPDLPQEEKFSCSPNDSAAIPLHLPQHYQDFRRYRHCRTFPTLLSPSPCEDDLHLLLAIKSTAVNLESRAAIRETWGRAGRIQGHRVKLIFLMGCSHDRLLKHDPQSVQHWESRSHGDILQWDLDDVFHNLTRKEAQFLNWFSRSFGSAQFVFKGDDDVFLNTENVITFLSNYKPESHHFTGHIHSPESPLRNKESKYFVPVEIFPEGKHYPRFPSGGGYVMSRQTVLGLDAVSQKMDLFPLDDVFLGMCLEQMGVNLVHHSGFLTFGLNMAQQRFGLCVHQEAMVVHKVTPLEMRVFWILLQVRQFCN